MPKITAFEKSYCFASFAGRKRTSAECINWKTVYSISKLLERKDIK